MPLTASILAFICSFTLASAGVIIIEQRGSMDQWENIDAYGLTSPVPYHWRLLVDESAIDQRPENEALGMYFGELFEISFGGYNVSIPGSRVEIWSGESGLYGFRFSNSIEHNQEGFTYKADEVFAFTLQPFDSSVSPTDELHWVIDSQLNPILSANNHQYLNSYLNGTELVHGESDENIQVYTATVIPEISSSLLIGVALFGFMALSRNRNFR